MGHDIVPTGRHLLDSSNVYNLAADLSQRLQANIKYGYTDSLICNDADIASEPSFNTIQLGEIAIPGATDSYWLCDDHYQLKDCYQCMGDRIFGMHWVKASPATIVQLKKRKFRQSYTLYHATAGAEWGYIYNDTLCCHAFYYSRWWTFCKAFTRENNFDFKGIQEYRLGLKLFFQKLGGHEIVYLDDQGETARYIGGEHDWAHIVNALEMEYAGKVLHIPQFMQHNTIWQAGDYPIIFYDDFTDL